MVILLLAFACTDKPAETGDTAPPVSFSVDLQFIFDRNCAYSGCHFPPEPEQGMDLSHGVAYTNIVGVPSVEVPALARVQPGDPEASYLYLKLNDRQAEVGGSGTRMPTELFLSAPEIAKFEEWILAGAPDN